ncbi:MAG: hypothetical protein K0Q49_37 [Haloplasmataceae bacterium]|jgi:uncharacterized lipoprotein YddW (UPF0748 family)|nr:hypothetical protein [Haloplasmataceae bacterium]
MKKSKLILLFLLSFMCFIGFSMKGQAAENNTFTINYNGMNQVRGTDQVIIYTYDKRTVNNKSGANPWGYEISVNEDGIIVEMAVNVTFAPNGFIISIHGLNNTALVQEEVKVGDQATYDTITKTISFTFSILGGITNLETQIKDLKNQKIELDLGAYDVDIVALNNDLDAINIKFIQLKTLGNEIMEMSESPDKQAKLAQAETLYNDTVILINQAYLKTIVPLKVEARGVWHRPNVYNGEFTIDGLNKTIEEFKSAGINQIYIETLWWGYSIGTSEYMGYHPRVKTGNYGDYKDYLTAFIDIAHKNGIEVHAWTETFFPSSDVKIYPQWLKDHPAWVNTTFNGGYIQTGKGTEEGFVFTDPANEEVRDFMTNVYKELVEDFDLDGIQFDYIRYPAENSLEHSSGYTAVAMEKFKAENNISSSSDLKTLLTQEKSQGKNELYTKWTEFRADQVTLFVEQAVNAMREVDPDIKISIAVGPDHINAKKELMQDWKNWVENGWIDIIAPMAYTHDIEFVKTVVKEMNELSNDLTYNYTGIGAFMEGTALSYTEQILASRNLKGLGSVIFASQNILEQTEMKQILGQGLNKITAISPNADIETLLDTVFDYIIDKSERIYVPKALMTSEQKNDLQAEFDKIMEMPMNNADDYYKIQNEIKALVYEINDYTKSVGAQRVKEDLFELIDNIDLKISRYLINYGYWNLQTTAERPATDTFTYPVVDTENPNENKDNKNNTLIYIIGGVVLVGMIGASTFLIIRKKK